MIDRIIKAYLSELRDYGNQPQEYKTSGIWTGAEKKFIFGKEIENDKLPELLKEFAKNELGKGISIIDGERHIENEIALWKEAYNLPLQVLSYPDKFGFNLYEFENIKTIGNATRISACAKIISDLTKGNVLEIGGGFGGIPFHLFRDFNFNRTYFNFDIPYVGLISKYFLTQMFPDKKFLFYGEDDIKNFANYDFVLMPHYMIKELPDNCCELVCNFNSLAEMGNSQIKEYLKQIDRLSTKYFFHVNHRFQAWFKNTDPKKLDIDENHIADLDKSEYRLPTERWRLLSKNLSNFSNFGDNINYWEYIFKQNDYRNNKGTF